MRHCDTSGERQTHGRALWLCASVGALQCMHKAAAAGLHPEVAAQLRKHARMQPPAQHSHLMPQSLAVAMRAPSPGSACATLSLVTGERVARSSLRSWRKQGTMGLCVSQPTPCTTCQQHAAAQGQPGAAKAARHSSAQEQPAASATSSPPSPSCQCPAPVGLDLRAQRRLLLAARQARTRLGALQLAVALLELLLRLQDEAHLRAGAGGQAVKQQR